MERVPKLTKLHFEFIADLLAVHARRFRDMGHEDFYDEIVDSTAFLLLKTNPRFDTDKFKERCGE